MDLDQLQYLSSDQKAKYIRLEKLFESDGWEDLMKWATVNKAVAITGMLNAANWEQYKEYKATAKVYDAVLALRESTDHEFEQMAADAQAATEEQDEVDSQT